MYVISDRNTGKRLIGFTEDCTFKEVREEMLKQRARPLRNDFGSRTDLFIEHYHDGKWWVLGEYQEGNRNER